MALTPEIAEALYVGARHRHRPLPVHEHDAEGAAARRRAGGGGRGRARGLPARLRDGAVRQTEAARARPRPGAGLRGRSVVVSYLLRNDFAEVGAVEPYSEGIIDYLRPAEGSELVGADPRAAARRRAHAPDLAALEPTTRSTSRRLRARSGGGGHRQAAGFSRRVSVDEIIEFIRREFVASRRARDAMPPRAPRPGRDRARRQAGRAVVVRARRGAAPPHRRAHRARRHARPVRDRAAACCCPARRLGLRRASSGWTSATSPTSTSRRRRRPAIRKGEVLERHDRAGRAELDAGSRASAARSSCRSPPPRR